MKSFIGRRNELQILADHLKQAQSGSSAICLVQGPAGIGKTALVREFVRANVPKRTIWTSGDEIESTLEFGVIDQLRRAAGLATAERDSLDPFSVGGELLALLGESDGDVLVLVVDDVQWADVSSLNALAFVISRLMAERLLVVLTCRDGHLDTLPPSAQALFADPAVTRLELEGLSDTELSAIATDLGHDLPREAVHQLREHTHGSPLYARALLNELRPEDLALAKDRLLRAPRSLAAVIADRLALCRPATTALCRAAALLGTNPPTADAAALAGLTDLTAALDEARERDLLVGSATDLTLQFSHPLVQAAVYQQIPDGERAELHRRAAARSAGRAHRLRHLIAAAIGPDGDLAAEVRAYAGQRAAQGAWSSAGELYLSAVRLAATEDDRDHALFDAFECLLFGGQAAAAIRLLDDIRSRPDTAHRDQVLGNWAMMTGEHSLGTRLLRRAWDQREAGLDDRVAAMAANQLAMEAMNDGDHHGALRWAELALELPEPAGLRGMPHCIIAIAHASLNRSDEGLASIPQLPRRAEEFEGGQVGALVGRGILRLWRDELGEAIEDLGLAEQAARSFGPLFLRLMALFYRADGEYRRGDWDAASIHAELAVTLGHEGGTLLMETFAAAVAVWPAAGRGEWERAAEYCVRATSGAQALGVPAARLWASMALARIAHARRDPAATVEALRWMADAEAGLDGADEPGIQPWALYYAEALVGVGDLDTAHRFLDTLEMRGRLRELRSTMVSVLRIRALAAVAEGRQPLARTLLEQALSILTEPPRNLEHALTHLEYGALLRRTGERRLALEHVSTAMQALARIGARPYLERCEDELDAIGHAQPADKASDVRVLLTTQEHAVGTLVASGLTNRQVATELVVSTKTVEYHLSNIFRKLSITNRSALVSRLA